ncbi:hypothetical protein IVE04_24155 [Pseudomonas mendocina]|nr:hypothetical protein [Pseudomonas mendocina]
MSITLESIEKLQESLRELPEVEDKSRELNKQEAVALLVDEVELLKKKGYSLEKIAELLTEGGLEIKPPTLKSYLSKARAGRKPKRSVKPKVARRPATPSAGKEASSKNHVTQTGGPSGKTSDKGQVKALENQPGEDLSKRSDTVSPGRFVPKEDSPEI